ncbi:MAG: amino acid-binding protein, partial [Clostridiales bacterium]|nr:amino acid-binding protein [Clostridiales bacterium]
MFVKQISVFLENSEGRLDEVLKILSQGGIDLVSACVADTMEYGILRLLAKEPDRARQLLKDA